MLIVGAERCNPLKVLNFFFSWRLYEIFEGRGIYVYGVVLLHHHISYPGLNLYYARYLHASYWTCKALVFVSSRLFFFLSQRALIASHVGGLQKTRDVSVSTKDKQQTRHHGQFRCQVFSKIIVWKLSPPSNFGGNAST